MRHILYLVLDLAQPPAGGRLRRLALSALTASAAAMAMPAAAQTSDVDRIETGVRRGPAGAFMAGERDGLRFVRPGALLLASYDRNLDGEVTREEVQAGADASFAVADTDKDGALSGFEQGEWARRVGGSEDVISNPMLFDTDLDRSVTPAEFSAGVQRLAAAARGEGEGPIRFNDLMTRAGTRRDPREDGG